MYSLANSAFCFLYKYTGVMYAQEQMYYRAGRNGLAILLLHRVTDEIPEDGLTVTTKWFREFCRVMQRDYNVVSLEEIDRILKTGVNPAPRTLAITFDDCYRDNLFAARLLAKHGLPATFFVPSKFVGTDHVFEWDKHLKQMPNLTWADVKEMVQLGHEIGSHGVSHPDFGLIGPEEARRELAESKNTLEERLQQTVRWLAYPFGGRNNFRPEYLSLAYELGYHGCFSGHGGFLSSEMAGGILPRIPVPEFRSVVKLELHLRGCLDWLYSLKRTCGLIA